MAPLPPVFIPCGARSVYVRDAAFELWLAPGNSEMQVAQNEVCVSSPHRARRPLPTLNLALALTNLPELERMLNQVQLEKTELDQEKKVLEADSDLLPVKKVREPVSVCYLHV